MAKKKRYRWECPKGKHPGQLGPGQPPLTATLRWCLPCSKATGTLVGRVCPRREKESAVKTEQALAKRQRKTAKKKEKDQALYVYGGYDLRKEAKKIVKLPEFHRLTRWGRTRVPRMIVRRRKTRSHTTGHSYGGRIVLTIPVGSSTADAIALLAHELAHEATPDHHGAAWRAAFISVVTDLYKGELVLDDEADDSSFDLHRAVEAALEKVL